MASEDCGQNARRQGNQPEIRQDSFISSIAILWQGF